MERKAYESVGFLGLLFLLLAAFKLLHVISMSWVWVTAPLWAGFALLTVAFLIFMGGVIIVAAHDRWRRHRIRKQAQRKESQDSQGR